MVEGFSFRNKLPRLVYLADVPVEASFHRSMLLYRLLEEYPPDKLLILEPTAARSSDSRRLQNVKHLPFWIGWPRLLHSRFARILWLVRRPIRSQLASENFAASAMIFENMPSQFHRGTHRLATLRPITEFGVD
jgi:hypothetical protein